MSQRTRTEKSGREIQSRLTETRLIHHNLKFNNRRYLERVFSNVQKKMNRPEDDQMLDLEINVLTCGSFMSATLKATIHLGLDHNANLFTYKNTDFEELKTLFDITQKPTLEQKHEMTQIPTTERHVTPWVGPMTM